MHLTSPAFEDGQELPARFTCDGDQIAPPLAWDDVPNGTQSLALIIEDPDAPSPTALNRHTFTHCLIFNLPSHAGGLGEGSPHSAALPEYARFGTNDGRDATYFAPCPPRGRHRYIHRLYALDTVLSDLVQPNRNELLDAMEGHVLATAELTGTFERH